MGFYSGCICDKCGASIAYEGVYPKWLMTNRARENGWTVGKRVLCPNCKNKIRVRRKKVQ